MNNFLTIIVMELLLNDAALEILIHKIVMTLLCSLGLGLVLAALSGGVLLITRNQKASIRYNALTGLLCMFVMCVGVVFCYQPESESNFALPATQNGRVGLFNDATSAMMSPTTTGAAHGRKTGIANFISTFLERHSATITLLWLLVVIFKMAQMVRGVYALNYLKKNKIYDIGQHWETILQTLALKIGVSRPVRIMQSGLVKVPMVMGHFKPVILIPLGAITSIPADQIEMILLHELAHIRRLDFFVNLLQHFAELLFFFNPAVLWISYLIRKERENCCDDLAIAYSGNRKTYITALLSFSEYEGTGSVYSMAFARESNLLDRVRRIAFSQKATFKFSEKLFLAVTFLLLFSVSILLARVYATENAHENRLRLVSSPVDKGLKTIVRSAFKAGEDAATDMYTMPILNLAPIEERSGAVLADSLPKTGGAIYGSNYKLIELDTLPGVGSGTIFKTGQLLDLKAGDQLQPLRNLLIQHSQESSHSAHSTVASDSGARYNNGYRYYRSFGEYSTELRQGFRIPDNLGGLGSFGKSINLLFLDEMENAGVKFDRNNVQLHITNDELVVDGVRQSSEIHKQVISKLLKKPGDKIDFTYGTDNK